MRFQHVEKVPGALRVRTRFLLLPKRIQYETRWLERATYSQKLVLSYGPDTGISYDWIDQDWLD